jgi:hypothetical protein
MHAQHTQPRTTNPRPQVRNLDPNDDAYTVIDLKAMGLSAEYTHLANSDRVAPQLPLPTGVGAAQLRVTARAPPFLQSVKDREDFQARLGGAGAPAGRRCAVWPERRHLAAPAPAAAGRRLAWPATLPAAALAC